MMRAVVEKIISLYGYELKIKDAPLRGFERFLAQCKRRGLSVNTVIDGGVGRGTPWLYEAFPDAKIILFEPLEEFQPNLEKVKKQYNCEYHIAALGNRNHRSSINISQHFLTSSSLLNTNKSLNDKMRDDGLTVKYTKREIDVLKLDNFFQTDSRYFLKFDVEGYEIQALEGAKNCLTNTEMIILEISVLDRYHGEPRLNHILNFLESNNFCLYEIVSESTRYLDGPISYIDVAFVPTDSILRR